MPKSGSDDEPTRERLLSAAIRLFAEHGYANVGVGDVEQAAGLVPRRGALYRHFASKEALLEAAVHRYVHSGERAFEQLDSLEGDLTQQATALGRLILQEMDAQHGITRILERDGDRLPHLVEEFRNNISERGYSIVAGILRSWLSQTTGARIAPGFNPDVAAVLLSGALINARRSTWTLGYRPGGHDDESLVASWTHLCVAVVSTETHK